MRAAFRTDRLATEGTILDRRGYLMSTITGVKRAHDLHVPLAAGRAWCLIHNKMAGMAFVSPFCKRYIIFR